jgi:hypothetical protein
VFKGLDVEMSSETCRRLKARKGGNLTRVVSLLHTKVKVSRERIIKWM